MDFMLRLTEAINAACIDCALRKSSASFNERAELREARIFRQSSLVTSINLLNDPGDL